MHACFSPRLTRPSVAAQSIAHLQALLATALALMRRPSNVPAPKGITDTFAALQVRRLRDVLHLH